MEHSHGREKTFATEKLKTYEKHIRMLQDDNARLTDSLKVRANQMGQSTVHKQL